MSEAVDTNAGRSDGSGHGTERRGFFSRIALFFRQVIDQMRKVVWPTRTELLGYFVVVLVFVLAVMAYVGVLDLAFARLTMLVFG